MDTSVAIGDVLSGYRLESLLGKGGMGAVFMATHLKLGRKVAIKVLAAGLAAEAEYVSRFLHEAKIVNDVRHPNIVDISDFIEEDRRVAYVMELIEGPSLGAVLKKQRLSVRQAINVSLQLASALEAVHAVQVVHRDLKPDNVLVVGSLASDLSMTPSVKILDFGIAKSSDAQSKHKTATGAMLGTPTYMAPEQIAAEPVSPATDIYALAEIFYEMVTGERVFRGDAMPILKGKLTGAIPPLAVPADVAGSEMIAALVRACLALNPAERPSLAQFCGGVTSVLAMQPDAPLGATPTITAPPSVTIAPFDTSLVPPKAKKSRAWMYGIPVVAALAAGGVYWSQGQAEPPVTVQLKEDPPPPPPAPVPAPAPVVIREPEPKPEPAKIIPRKVISGSLKVEPAGAEVFDEKTGARVDATRPIPVPRRLVVKASGYHPQTIELTATQPNISVKLVAETKSPIKKKELKAWE